MNMPSGRAHCAFDICYSHLIIFYSCYGWSKFKIQSYILYIYYIIHRLYQNKNHPLLFKIHSLKDAFSNF